MILVIIERNKEEDTMKVKVNQDACIGCGACAAICDVVFKINDEGLSTVIKGKEEVKEEMQQEVRDAADACPTGAIEVE